MSRKNKFVLLQLQSIIVMASRTQISHSVMVVVYLPSDYNEIIQLKGKIANIS